MTQETGLQTLSNEISKSIEQASGAIVLVQGKRFPASGIVWQKNLVVTAEHLLPKTSQLQIITGKEQVVTGIVTGRDPSTDIAVIQVSTELQPLEPSDQNLKTGELAVIFGRANGGRPLSVLTMISGVDAIYKNWRGGTFDQFIRLDTGSFPGFSGSALLLPNGKVAGMNTSVFSRHFGLTVPASNIERLVQRIAAKGTIGRPYLGLMMQPIRLQERLRQTAGTEIGLLLIGTENGSPADQAGLFAGDIVVRLKGKPLNSMDELHDLLTMESIGTDLNLTILRGGKIEDVQLKVGERPLRQ